jgi:UDP-3-O-[3-hydroxymyristoyl] glucosamine N-acyltransferase
VGDPLVRISGLGTLGTATEGQITFLANPKYAGQVAHNCVIGNDCIIVAQTGIAGSARLGKHVTLGGQVAIVGHISIGDNAMISGQSGVMRNVAVGEVMSGTPAIPHHMRLKSAAVFPHLPAMRKSLARLETRITKVEEETMNSRTVAVTRGRS